ncbi:MAG: hypothetical protein ACTSSQ_06465, partial [Alphaproteobacteria bacterium]
MSGGGRGKRPRVAGKTKPSGFAARLPEVDRRTVMKLAGAVAAVPMFAPPVLAQSRARGLSIFGDLALPADFTHLPYVNPDAPKGGKFTFLPPNWGYNQNPQTFNTLNGYVTRGDAPP